MIPYFPVSESTMREPLVIAGPSFEPVSVFEVQQHCRIDTDDYGQKKMLEIYISAARDYMERRTGRTLHEKTLEWTLQNWPLGQQQSNLPGAYNIPIKLPRATPLIEVISIKYTDSSGVENTWDPAQYQVDTSANVGLVYPKYGFTYPTFVPAASAPIRIRYRAGIAVTSPITEIQPQFKYMMLVLVAAMFANAEAEIMPDRSGIQFISPKLVEDFLSGIQAEYAF